MPQLKRYHDEASHFCTLLESTLAFCSRYLRHYQYMTPSEQLLQSASLHYFTLLALTNVFMSVLLKYGRRPIFFFAFSLSITLILSVNVTYFY